MKFNYRWIIASLFVLGIGLIGSFFAVKLYRAKVRADHFKKLEQIENNKPILRIKLVNHFAPHLNQNDFYGRVINNILKEKYRIQYDEQNYDLIIDSVRGRESIKDLKGIKIFFTGEAALPNIDDYDLVIGFNRIEHPRYIRMPYYYTILERETVQAIDNMRSKFGGSCAPKEKEHFACFLASNGGGVFVLDTDENGINNSSGIGGRNIAINEYIGNGLPFDGVAARNRLFFKLSLYKHVESGGAYLNNIGKPVPFPKTNDWLSRCKFTIAYENQSYDGYITEKVFNAYFAGTIPIYYSHPNAVLDVNKKAIIYAGDFGDEDALVEYIKKVDNDDKLYCDIWNENLITNPEMNFEAMEERLRQKLFKLLDEKLHK